MNGIVGQVVKMINPNFCLHCKKVGPLLCQNCRQGLEWYPFLYFDQTTNRPTDLATKNIESIEIACVYNQVAKSLLTQLKFHGVKAAGQLIAEIMYLTLNLKKVDCLVPVPLHPKKKAIRGYNQSAVIAKRLSELTGIKSENLLRRNIFGQSQVEKSSRLLRKRVKQNPFITLPLKKIPPSVLLIDDVVTTGTTLNLCAEALKKVGVKKISVAVFAHSL